MRDLNTRSKQYSNIVLFCRMEFFKTLQLIDTVHEQL